MQLNLRVVYPLSGGWPKPKLRKKKKTMSLYTKAEEQKLQPKLQKEYLSGTWRTYHEAALRHGVPDSIIGRLMRRVKLGIAETVKEQRDAEVDRVLLQIEGTIGRALESFEISRKQRYRCKPCKGLGESADGETCVYCDGDGWVEELRPGDSKQLMVVLKALEQKAKIFAMHPERRSTKIGQLNLIQGGDEQNPLMGASTELLIRARRLFLELKEGGGNGKQVLDVEVEKGTDDNKKEETG